MTLQKDINQLDKALSDFKTLTIDRFAKWFFGFKYAVPFYAIVWIISVAYVLTSLYYTFN